MAPEITVQVEDEPGRGDLDAHLALLRRAAEATLRRARADDAFLSVTLLPDASIAAMNAAHLGDAGPTDVISFRLEGPDGRLEGDVYVGHEVAARTAAEERISAAEELVRLTVHGTLHVLGHDHVPGPERTAGEMWRLQEELVREVMREARAASARPEAGTQ